jgi:type I restriction enzyme, S subunit
VEKPLGEIAEFKNGLNFSQNSLGQSVRVVGVGDFQSNSIVPTADLGSVTIDGNLNENYAIRKNDILTVRSNGSKDLVGRCMLVPDVPGVVSFSGFIIRIRFDTNALDPKFLLHFMKCSATRDRLTREGGGANISNINQEKLSSLSVPLPSLSIQQKEAERLDGLQLETQNLESLYQRKLAALDELKKSLLHRAFSGVL